MPPLQNEEMAGNKEPSSVRASDYGQQCILPSLSAMAVLRSEHLPDLSLYTPTASSMNSFSRLQASFDSSSLCDRWKIARRGDPGINSAGELDAPKDRLQTIKEAEPARNELDLYEWFLRDVGGLASSTLFQPTESPLFRAIDADMERLRGIANEFERQLDQAQDMQDKMLQLIKYQTQGHDDTESWIDLVSGGRRESVPDISETPQDEPPVAEPKPVKTTLKVVFNSSQTETRANPDGSIWRKTITTKRFADGREETDESVEVHHPPPEKIQLGGSNEQEPNEKPKGGWFWKE